MKTLFVGVNKLHWLETYIMLALGSESYWALIISFTVMGNESPRGQGDEFQLPSKCRYLVNGRVLY